MAYPGSCGGLAPGSRRFFMALLMGKFTKAFNPSPSIIPNASIPINGHGASRLSMPCSRFEPKMVARVTIGKKNATKIFSRWAEIDMR